jgi:hypothetical protein
MPIKDPIKQKEYNKEWGKKNNKKVWERRKNNPEYIAYAKAYMKEYNKKFGKEQERTPKKRLSNLKSQCKKRGLEFDISLDEFIDEISKPCVYCNNLLGEKSVTASGLDRKDNSKGYVVNNVCSCCWVCNSIKGEHLSFEEMKEVVKLVLTMRGIIKNDY